MVLLLDSIAYGLVDINDRMPRAEAEAIFSKIKAIGELFILARLTFVVISPTSARS